MAGNSQIRRLADYTTRRPVVVDTDTDFLPVAPAAPEAPPERVLALSVIYQAVADVRALRLGYQPDEYHYSAAAFLTGREDYRIMLRFWCQVADIDAGDVTARAWRDMRTRLAVALRYQAPIVKRSPRV